MRMKGDVLDEWPVYTPLVNADKVINVPVAKHHNLSKYTAAMKNWYGVLGGRRNRLHQNIDVSIADLATFMRPTLTVVDATRVLMRNGPQGGNIDDAKDMHQVIASLDQVAADAYGCTLIGEKPENVPYLKMGHERGIGTMTGEMCRMWRSDVARKPRAIHGNLPAPIPWLGRRPDASTPLDAARVTPRPTESRARAGKSAASRAARPRGRDGTSRRRGVRRLRQRRRLRCASRASPRSRRTKRPGSGIPARKIDPHAGVGAARRAGRCSSRSSCTSCSRRRSAARSRRSRTSRCACRCRSKPSCSPTRSSRR